MIIYVGVYSLVSNGWLVGATVNAYDGSSLIMSNITGSPDGEYGSAKFDGMNENYTYRFEASYSGHITQSKNFMSSGTSIRTDFYMVGAGTDIQVDFVNVAPSTIRMGETFVITGAFKNYGSSGSQVFPIYSDNIAIGSFNPIVNTGSSQILQKSYTTGACPQLCEGTHTILVGSKSTILTISQYYYKCENSICNKKIKIGSEVSDCTGENSTCDVTTIPCDAITNIKLFGGCYPKSDVYIAAGLIVVIMMMR